METENKGDKLNSPKPQPNYGSQSSYGGESEVGHGRRPEPEEPVSEYGSGYGGRPARPGYGGEQEGGAYPPPRRSEDEEGSGGGYGYGRENKRNEEYGYGGRTEKPSYGRTEYEKPEYERPSYEEEPPRRPSCGKPNYEQQEDESYPKPSYGISKDFYPQSNFYQSQNKQMIYTINKKCSHQTSRHFREIIRTKKPSTRRSSFNTTRNKIHEKQSQLQIKAKQIKEQQRKTYLRTMVAAFPLPFLLSLYYQRNTQMQEEKFRT
ncbi:uncharacterized protein At5g39570-like [Telopea speciosissima]|uniref:uncharacterized protein At5g39570-like n=1 Tax=Telopea speciosissima TaxID=54955 RepID=UPI001CC4814C|nr:uncharacterized protein At5g39570-like [Telopea speciosissima]